MNIQVPVHNEDGSIQYTTSLNPQQTQALIGFALNFLVANGLAKLYGVETPADMLDDAPPEQGDLFN